LRRRAAITSDVTAAGLPLVVGLERSDFTKGIPERLRAVAAAYRDGAVFSYVGIAAPTRQGVAVYEPLEEAITEAAEEAQEAAQAVGGRFLHAHQAIPWRQVLALQRDADVVFTSSLSDGMNLVPLQAAAVQSLRPPDSRGVILTGRDAGVSSVFTGFGRDGLVPVDPLDHADMVRTLEDAVARRLPGVSSRLIDEVRRHDARIWGSRFLADLEEAVHAQH
jgi:trehalose 6-phosphate synthase